MLRNPIFCDFSVGVRIPCPRPSPSGSARASLCDWIKQLIKLTYASLLLYVKMTSSSIVTLEVSILPLKTPTCSLLCELASSLEAELCSCNSQRSVLNPPMSFPLVRSLDPKLRLVTDADRLLPTKHYLVFEIISDTARTTFRANVVFVFRVREGEFSLGT